MHDVNTAAMNLRTDSPCIFLPDGRSIPVDIRRHRRARRISLRYDAKSQSVRLTLPLRASAKEGMRFVEEKRNWLLRRIASEPPRATPGEGDAMHILGASYRLHFTGAARGRVEAQDGALHIPGGPEFRERRLKDWLKATAQRELTVRTHEKAAQLAALFPHPPFSQRERAIKVHVRDTRARWGSCSSDGRLNFSWRLLLAPLEVMEYVICHEVAHLAEMNHSARFWKIVAELCPHHATSRAWLRKHGEALHARLP